jgi:hypothetical protein
VNDDVGWVEPAFVFGFDMGERREAVEKVLEAVERKCWRQLMHSVQVNVVCVMVCYEMSIIRLRTASSIRATLSSYHPVFIEGPSRNDNRDPQVVAEHIVTNLRRHWSKKNDDNDRGVDEVQVVGEMRIKDDIHNKPPRPLLLIIQGDPYTPHGISAITRIVAMT